MLSNVIANFPGNVYHKYNIRNVVQLQNKLHIASNIVIQVTKA